MKKTFISISAIFILFAQAFSQNQTYTSLDVAFINPEKVRTLDLSGQELTSLPDSLTKFVNIFELNISINNFNHIPPVVFQLKSLEVLRFSGAFSYIDKYDRYDYLLDSIPDEIAQLVNLKSLSFDHQAISVISPKINELKNLVHLDLFHNSIPVSQLINITGLSSLESLDIGGNELTDLPDEFSKLKSLTLLWLDNNFSEGAPAGVAIEQIPPALFKLEKLEQLSLMGQEFKKIPSEIKYLKKLRVIDVSFGMVRKFPKSIRHLTNLEELRADALCLGGLTVVCEKKTKIPKEICELKKLKQVSLAERKFSKKTKKRLEKCFGAI